MDTTALVWSLLLAFSCCCSSAYSFPEQVDLYAGVTSAAADRKGLISLEDKLASSFPAYNRKLLQSGSQGESLLAAAKDGDYSEVERLIGDGADPNYVSEDGISVLMVAILNNYGSIVTLLISKGVPPGGPVGSDWTRYGSLQAAAQFGAASSAAALLDAGVPVDGINSFGYSALHDAARYGFTDVAELLLDNGASVNLLSEAPLGGGALHYAAALKHYGVASLLISRGAEVDVRSGKYGETPLHAAAKTDSPLVIQLLIDNGAEIDARSGTGRTPLWLAALFGAENSIEVFILNGADKSIKVADTTPREALCQCTFLDEIIEICQVDACEDATKMIQLLQ